jgi:cell division protein FtsL
MPGANRKQSAAQPVVRFRVVAAWCAVIGLVIACPLFVVWRQVYLRDVSIRRALVSDSLSQCSRELARLRIISEKYAATPRIESIAREKLGLEYPTADRIVILDEKENTPPVSSGLGEWRLLAILKRSITGDNGS